jgi:Domain of unknown function (DUF4386)
MPTTLSLPAAPAATQLRSRTYGPLGALLILEAMLSFAPLIVLGSAIGWPASLAKPAAEQLAAIGAAPDAVALGYGVYLLYSVLIAPLMVGLAARNFGGLSSPLAATVAAFGMLSALARSIGILRWLTVMPLLASAHAAGDAATQTQVALVFDAMHAYGGGIGEILGVSLFMALAIGLMSVGGKIVGSTPTWLAILGLATAVALAALAAPSFGLPKFMPVAAAVSLLSVWMLVTGVWCLQDFQPTKRG